MTSEFKITVPSSNEVPFNQASFVGKELDYITEAIRIGHISGDGKFTRMCSDFLQKTMDVKKCLLTSSCTDALEMAAILLNILPGDEVIVPSYTFVSTINAFVLRGAVPRFVDIRRDTLNLDEEKVFQLINQKTKAIVPVHYAGVACEMDKIMDIARQFKIAVVEDNAHGLFGKYKGSYLGTFGQLATQSFHETKNFTCGEGGALLINDESLIDRAEIIRDKGTNRKKFFRGMVDKYTWVDIGSSFLPSDILSAFLYAQFESYQTVQSKRQKIWNYYYSQLKEWADVQGVQLPFVPVNCDQAFHMFYIVAPSLSGRTRLQNYLKERNIYSVFHYLPLHLSEMGVKFGGKKGDCPVSEDYSDRLLRLPFFTAITEQQLERTVEQIRNFSF